MKWISPWRLRRLGILGMNCRNRDFIGRYNARSLYPRVDDKLKTKLLARSHGLATPSLLFVVSQQQAINQIEESLRRLQGFAIKPARGAGGRGILVITGQEEGRFVKSSGATIGMEDIRRHLSNTLAGLYSLGGKPDVALVEELVQFDESFAGYSHQGVPDIRVIVFKGYPVMAMARLATRASDGKANLHQGALGVGLDIATGGCLQAVQFARPLRHHPDTGKALDGLRLDNWRDLLVLAAGCHEMTGLGYIGADIVLDRHKGPQLLELNARPGLAIQMANGMGLLPRLRHIEGLRERHLTPGQRVDYVRTAFSGVRPLGTAGMARTAEDAAVVVAELAETELP